MNLNDLLDLLNNSINNSQKISSNELNTLILDMTRVIDSKITQSINNYKKNYKKTISSSEKEKIRLYFLGYPIQLSYENIDEFYPIISTKDIQSAINLIDEGISRDKTIIIDSLIARYKKNFLNHGKEYTDEYLKYVNSMQKQLNQLIILNINANDNLTTQQINNIIKKQYSALSNYHYMIVLFNDNNDNVISWDTIANVAIYMENFKLETNFNVFQKRNRQLRIEELSNFLIQNEFIDFDDQLYQDINDFYEGVSYGFQFEDLLITQDGKTKVLIMQKVELDETPKKCPSCLKEQARGNSYPKILYKSFECQNPSCPSRSKNGRGKRYDLFGAKRKMMLEKNSNVNKINDDLYYAYRRDIIDNNRNIIEDLILLYSWSNDHVLILKNQNNHSEELFNKRFLKYKQINIDNSNGNNLDCLPIYKLFKSIHSHINFKQIQSSSLNKKIYDNNIFINDNSSLIFTLIDNLKIDAVITSPPYYNAREYSQWPNLICYLCDMMINAKSVFSVISTNGTYIYNIGDIVDQDNIYIKSNMSKRRQILGFYSIMIFNIVGFEISHNIIWDKGEVQSKRNATSNHFSGYLKPINVYEHNLVFKKNNSSKEKTIIKKIDPVKKINSKGQNVLGHTAPFPIEIAELILPYCDNNYILDPFLGSGTTMIMAKRHNISAIGFEINPTYYNLSIQRYLNDNTLF